MGWILPVPKLCCHFIRVPIYFESIDVFDDVNGSLDLWMSAGLNPALGENLTNYFQDSNKGLM